MTDVKGKLSDYFFFWGVDTKDAEDKDIPVTYHTDGPYDKFKRSAPSYGFGDDWAKWAVEVGAKKKEVTDALRYRDSDFLGKIDAAYKKAQEGSTLEGTTPLGAQVAGSHYAGKIQPIEFIQKNDIPYCEANVIKYTYRHLKKGGIEDLRKARHYLELIAYETYGEEL